MKEREAAVSAALATHSVARAASRHLPAAQRVDARRASSAAYVVAIDEAHPAYRAAITLPAAVEPMGSAGVLAALSAAIERAEYPL